MPVLPLPEPSDYAAPTNWTAHPSGQAPWTAPEPGGPVAMAPGSVPVPQSIESPATVIDGSGPPEPVQDDPGVSIPPEPLDESPAPAMEVASEAQPSEQEVLITPFPAAAPTVSGADVTQDVNQK